MAYRRYLPAGRCRTRLEPDRHHLPASISEAAEAYFANLAETWRDIYPAMISSWEAAWNEFMPFLAFPTELLSRRGNRQLNYANGCGQESSRWSRESCLRRRRGTGCVPVAHVQRERTKSSSPSRSGASLRSAIRG